jgi:putative ABC transport system permease protein
MARTLWPGASAVGRIAAIDLNGGLSARVIGVVGDIHVTGARTAARPGFYLAPGRFAGEAYDIVVRSSAPPAAAIAGMRAALSGIDPAIPLHRIQTLDDLVGGALARDRFVAVLLGAFAALALALASVGIYGVFAGEVAARRKEIGIRIALGARPRRVLSAIVGRALASAAIGVALGGAAAALLARSMRTLLFGIETTDPWSFAIAAAALLAVTLAATIIPAAHATRVSPMLIARGD